MDSDEATQAQLHFVARVKRFYDLKATEPDTETESSNPYEFRIHEPLVPYETELTIPKKFQHVDLDKILDAKTRVDELLSVLKKVHPWSSLHYGLTAADVVKKTLFGMDTQICRRQNRNSGSSLFPRPYGGFPVPRDQRVADRN